MINSVLFIALICLPSFITAMEHKQEISQQPQVSPWQQEFDAIQSQIQQEILPINNFLSELTLLNNTTTVIKKRAKTLTKKNTDLTTTSAKILPNISSLLLKLCSLEVPHEESEKFTVRLNKTWDLLPLVLRDGLSKNLPFALEFGKLDENYQLYTKISNTKTIFLPQALSKVEQLLKDNHSAITMQESAIASTSNAIGDTSQQIAALQKLLTQKTRELELQRGRLNATKAQQGILQQNLKMLTVLQQVFASKTSQTVSDLELKLTATKTTLKQTIKQIGEFDSNNSNTQNLINLQSQKAQLEEQVRIFTEDLTKYQKRAKGSTWTDWSRSKLEGQEEFNQWFETILKETKE